MDEFGRRCPDDDETRLVGDYIVGPKIGYGSFAVVWKARHKTSNETVAVKEIDKSCLQVKVRESLIKEISILKKLDHPNIIKLFEAFETEDKIFLVLEYCDEGDLARYLHRYGRVSMSFARQLMMQLAAGLHVLQENHLIHRDLKPQNLLLSKTDGLPLLKIGDFGFARSLTPHDLAATLCGSPLYMAPEVFKNQKYDGKADLWSVGAILFQLVIGRPPFNGNDKSQLFQNIMESTKLQFPSGTFEELHPDCVDLCRRLLCQNPVERISFEEFFNHKFLKEPREMVISEESSMLPQTKLRGEPCHFLPSETRPHMSPKPKSFLMNLDSKYFKLCQSGHASTSVADSMDNVEEEYVLVNPHTASGEISFLMAPSVQETSSSQTSSRLLQLNEQDGAIAVQDKELPACTSRPENQQKHGPYDSDKKPLCVSTIIKEVEGLTILHPSTRLQLLDQFAQAVEELARERYNAGLVLESFSVELIVLAIRRKAHQISSSWLSSSAESGSSKTGLASITSCTKEVKGLTSYKDDNVDFSRPSSVNMWAERKFILAYDHAEEVSYHVQRMDGASEMPDAMDLIFNEALEMGKVGAVYESMGNKGKTLSLYSKAILLFSFLLQEAGNLQLNPPLSLSPTVRKQIERYIANLKAHVTQVQTPESSSKYTEHSHAK